MSPNFEFFYVIMEEKNLGNNNINNRSEAEDEANSECFFAWTVVVLCFNFFLFNNLLCPS